MSKTFKNKTLGEEVLHFKIIYIMSILLLLFLFFRCIVCFRICFKERERERNMEENNINKKQQQKFEAIIKSQITREKESKHVIHP